MKAAPLALLKATLLGLAALLSSVILAFLMYSDGVRMNTDAWPPHAKSILMEQPNEPISADQWRRIDHALRAHGGNARASHVFAGEVRNSWPLYLLFPGLALLLVRRLKPLPPLLAGLIVVSPSFLLMLASFLHLHPYYR